MENAWEWLVVSINFLKRTRILENDLKNRLFRWATMRQTEKESYRLKTQELAGFKEGLINTILMQGGTPPMCVPAGASAHNSSWDLERGFQRRRGKKRKWTPKHARMIKNCAFAPGQIYACTSSGKPMNEFIVSNSFIKNMLKTARRKTISSPNLYLCSTAPQGPIHSVSQAPRLKLEVQRVGVLNYTGSSVLTHKCQGPKFTSRKLHCNGMVHVTCVTCG